MNMDVFLHSRRCAGHDSYGSIIMKYLLAIGVIGALLTGCGSGGSTSETAMPQNREPVANAGGNQVTESGQSVPLSGASSHDPDGDSLTYTWNIVSSPSGSNPVISPASAVSTDFSADVAGSYDIQLSVSDGVLSDTDSVTVTVIDRQSASLIAEAGGSYSAPEGLDIQLDGSGSADPGRGALTYSWEIKSGPANSVASLAKASSATPVLRATSIGSYEIELKVTSESGNTATDTANVLVYDYFPLMHKVEHYTQILPADDTRIVYVSSSEGDDANNGFSSKTPVKTIGQGISLLRDGFPDWLALKSGDSWETGVGAWAKSGRSQSEPMVITSYGAGAARPLLRTHDESAFRFQGGGGSPEYVNYLVIHGLHFYAASRDPNSSEFTGASADRAIVWLRGTNGLLIEDNLIQFYKEGITLQESDGFDIRNVLIKNNVIVDSYHTIDAHSQGIFLKQTDHVRIERNVFDHVGWNNDVPGAEPTKFNHSIYVQFDNRDISIVDNIITRSSSNGVQLRPGGLLEGNVLVHNPISLMLSGDNSQGDPGIIKNNVVLHGNDITELDPRGWGIDITPEIVSAEVTGNIVAHEASTSNNPMAISENSLSAQSGNVVFEWGEQSQIEARFSNPSVTILDFDKHVGGDGTLVSFISNIRSHSLRKPNPKYNVENIRSYFQEAFSVQN
ncbi:PKD domain-containing protein [Microbulbifer sp. SH-1]|nr:PKD domain-containing protein [Microbulbifer sp. SH-1]